MKRFINYTIPIIAAFSLVLLVNSVNSAPVSFGQMMMTTNQTNQTMQNSTQQAQQQLDQANQQIQQAQQQKEQAQQQLQEANQTQQQQSNQSKNPDSKMNEKLLNYTNAAILALNDDNTSAVQDSLQQIQSALINASGKQVVIVPAPAVESNSDDGDSS